MFVRTFYREAGDSLNDCRIKFVTEIYKIEEPGSSEDPGASSDSPLKSESDFLLSYRIVIDRYWLFYYRFFCTLMYPITDMQNRYLFTVIK